MKPILLQYLKIFLLMGISFGLLTSIIDLIFGEEIHIWGLLFKIVFFGGFMSLGLVSTQIIILKRMGVKNITAEDLKVRQKRSIFSTTTKAELIQKLKTDPHTSNMAIEDNGNEIDIKSGISFWSWGENIKIKINPAHAPENEYLISSEPKIKLTMVDSGRNLLHINRIGQLLQNA